MTSPRSIRRGFTLIEILMVIFIVLTLMALLLSAIGPVVVGVRKASSQALIDGLVRHIEQYSMEYGSYPIKPGGNGLDSSSSPDFYQTPCAPMGSIANGSEDNSALYNLLVKETHFAAKTKNVVGGRLVDDFGSPVIVRFLVLNTTNGKTVRVVAWSYGHDGKNDVNATPAFNCATPPADDLTEWNNIQTSLAKNSDDPHVP